MSGDDNGEAALESPSMTSHTASLSLEENAGALTCHIAGDWQAADAQPATLRISPGCTSLDFDCTQLGRWDSSLLARLLPLAESARLANCPIDDRGLPSGLARLLRLALAVPARRQPAISHEEGVLEHAGNVTLAAIRRIPDSLGFIGDLFRSLGRLCIGRARFQRSDLLLFAEDTGPRALPIVSLISFLVGIILAYMGAAQLARLGAQIYIADLVGIGMVREIAALMTGIILAGRTGAAYAAQLGTMQVNEEIDAFRTFGLPVTDYLVLPRFLSLLVMAPLLTLYAGIVGIAAGMVIATTVFDVGAFAYFQQSVKALDATHFLVGMIKGTVYGACVAIAGCLCGMRCGRSAQAVGEATTAAVVLGILLITLSASVLTILFQRLGI